MSNPVANSGPPSPGRLTVADIISNDSWALAEGEHEGKPLFIRFRDEFRSKPNVSAFPRLIRVVWTYEADENGLPTAEAIPEIRDFESRLLEAVQPAGIAVLVAAVTNNGEREWMLYATEVAAFGRCLEQVQEGYEVFPIDITSERDPKWAAFYEDILGSLG